MDYSYQLSVKDLVSHGLISKREAKMMLSAKYKIAREIVEYFEEFGDEKGSFTGF